MGSPYSFFKYIFINPQLLRDNRFESILKHEQAHAQQWHSLDLLVVELLRVFFWCNPFIRFYQKNLKELHEFLADESALGSFASKKEYAKMLLEFSLEHQGNPCVSYFDSSLTKRRIIMILNPKIQVSFIRKFVLLMTILFISFGFLVIPAVIAKDPQTFKGSSFLSKWPIKAPSLLKVSSSFGPRLHPIEKREMFHNGVDLVAKIGTPIFAPEPGIIVAIKIEGKYGLFLALKHNENFTTVYSQLDKFGELEGNPLKTGDQISAGHILGYVGNSGVSTGPHLHYEIRQDGKPVDPLKFVAEKH